ncbi:hypothetical protein J2Y58_002921 [Sphingomonas sp. BE138]|uniref:hypothetical protein n=1 Tax=Sphingomonas sp. BE138 TaxID=2817845 RepID=UPI002867826E|nr:hypothetical protein [Sphingomonas sp. BE138]MDR6789548.1 hypothetical protein [Sphingomonas sp. BE138]
MTPASIETAPLGDGWILGLVHDDDRPAARHHPWVILTRCDTGWADEDGYLWSPTHWARLPDPQPPATGWRPPAGEIVVEVGWFGEERSPVWLASIVCPDGSYDEERQPDVRTTVAAIEECARKWSGEIGLPWRRGQMSHADAVVVPFTRKPRP